MLLLLVGVLLAIGITTFEVSAHSHLGKKLAAARMCPPALYLRTTHVQIHPSQIGHVIPVNDHLKMIRHASGRSGFLLLPRPARPRPPMPAALKVLLFTFFSL
jgi:hypothetical protein